MVVALALALVLMGAVGAGAASGQAIVSLGFDDGYADQYAARPMLAAHGMHATFFIFSAGVGDVGDGYMTWSQLHDLAADGNEIAGHTIDHVDLTTVSAAEALHQVCDDRATLQAHGLQVTDFAYPYGTSDAAVEQIVQDCGYDSARTTLWYGPTCPGPCTESIPPRDPYATTVVGFSDQTLSELETVVRNAEAAGGWAQLVIHQVCDSGCAISPATLSALLDWLASQAASGAIAVETVHDVIRGSPPVPDTSITTGASGVTNQASPSFSFTSDAPSGVTFACRLDGPGAATGSWGGCSSPKGYTSLSDGSYTFLVRASNAAGADQTPASRSFTIDTAAPDTALTAGPSGTTADTSAVLAFAGYPDAASFECAVDGAAFAPCSSPVALSLLVPGSHTFAVRASDAAGNVDGTPASRTWSVDPAWGGPVTTSAPPAQTTSAPPAQTTSAPPLTASQEQPPGGTPTPSRRCVVPRLKALTLTSARNRLTTANCRLGKIRRQRHRGRAGIVLAQGERAGRSMPADTRITLTISRH